MSARRTPERLAKLPLWAQNEISRLERDLASERERLAAGPANSNTFADPFKDTPRPLGRDTLIRFMFGFDLHRSYIEVHREVERVNRPAHLIVRSSSALMVRPQSSNVIQVRDVSL